ncbi:MAG: HAD family hydrolase [Clostridia bacterium]|nr:HAD family hydrolase [Clostridia bacterium]
MGRFDGILICTDLDGTLYRNDKTISSENKEAIEYFKSEGGLFTFITGRMPYYSEQAYRAVGPNAPFGCVNGGGVYDGAEKRYVWTMPVAEGVFDLIESVDKALGQVGIQVCGFEKTYFSKENETTVRFRQETGLPYLPRHYREVDEPVAKVLFCTDREEELLEAEKILRAHPLADGFTFVRSAQDLFEILPKGASKGLALAKLTEYLGVDGRRTVVIGDYDNDVEMLRHAALGVAVANACPAAKAAANAVTVSNEAHAVARLIRDMEKGVYRL